MSEPKFFKWLAAESVARNGKTLKPGEVYATSDFPADVVAEWIRSGAAKPATSGKSERKDIE